MLECLPSFEEQTIELVQFEQSSSGFKKEVRGQLEWDQKSNGFGISFFLKGEGFKIEGGELGDSSRRLERVNELWTKTCFEAFWGLKGSEKYFELNFNLLGQWNIYSFDSYRSGMTELSMAEVVTVDSSQQEDWLRVRAWVLDSTFDKKSCFSLSFIYKDKSGKEEFWSNKHGNGVKPDFHKKENRKVVLLGED